MTPDGLDRDPFRVAANRVKQRTGQKGRALFHPIRVALTGEAGGPELDLAVPAIDRGAELPRSTGVAPIVGCRERAEMFARTLARRGTPSTVMIIYGLNPVMEALRAGRVRRLRSARDRTGASTT